MAKVTIKDIAQKAGVANSTVSRVLTNHPSVDPNTRARVKQIIKELGYRPSGIARGLVTGQINVVSLIIGDIRNPFYAGLTRAIKDILNKEGYMVVVSDTDYDAEKEAAHIQLASQYGFAGVIMVTALETKALISKIKTLDCPVVLLNRYLPSVVTDVVSVDNFQGGYLATEHLIKLGHKNIAHLAGVKNSTVVMDRIKGYAEALKDYGLEFNENNITYGDLKKESGYQYTELLLNQKKEATAVFCSNDLMALGLIEAMLKKGVSIPNQLSVVGYDDIDMATMAKVELTTVRQPQYEMGQAAAEILLERIQGKSTSNKRIIFTPELIVRESTAECKNKT
jgi:LacI family transcriptional regulator